MTITEALRALLRATDPGEHALPEAERLAAVRGSALGAHDRAFWSVVSEWAEVKQDVIALGMMLSATSGSKVDLTCIVPARVASRAALPATPPPECDRFITAHEFHAHESRDPLANLTPASRAHHQAFLEHESAVAEAAARQPHRRAGDVAREMPFVRATA